jgi:ATP-binding cassette subfamily G (WHITE) protein 2 (PDR)
MYSDHLTFEKGDHTAGQNGTGRTDPTRNTEDVMTQLAESEKREGVHTSGSSGSETLERITTQEETEEHHRDEEVTKLARKYTTQSHHSVYDKNPFEAKDHPVLDPSSAEFKPRAWAKSLLNLQARDPEKWKQRTAGFAFKDLNVYGFGSATDYQKSVVRMFLVNGTQTLSDSLGQCDARSGWSREEGSWYEQPTEN